MPRLPLCLLVLLTPPAVADVTFTQSATTVEAYDFLEVAAADSAPDGKINPFTDVTLTGEVFPPGGPPVPVAGFCDAADGSAFRLRFMPAKPGAYSYRVRLTKGRFTAAHEGVFTATAGKRKGPVRVDPKHPHHFVWEGTGEHCFWNGTTAYWLLGWTDEAVIRGAIDRLARLKVNRVRVALNGRTHGGERWYEPAVKNSDLFRFNLLPWPAKTPTDVKNPGIDTSRFDVAFWQKCERMLRHARERDVLVSVIFHLDGRDAGADPFNAGKPYPGGEAEWRYYRYAAARLAAFSNVTWDVTNEWHLFRDIPWVNAAAGVLRAADPYRHLMSVHGKEVFPFRTEPWADFAVYQAWDEAGGYAFMRKNRKLSLDAGRPLPQVNEEYGYEDHYPGPWGGGRKAPARSADTRRRLAWEMSMAGGYQTTGERADVPGQGGWLTGRGDDSMRMLDGYAHMVAFFTSFDWWRCDPADGAADGRAMVLADPGKRYAVYLPTGGAATVTLPDGVYTARWFDPRTGAWGPPAALLGGVRTLNAPDAGDWAVLLTK